MNKRIIHTVFDQHALLHPNRIALVEGEKGYTYAELKEYSEALARQILRFNAKPHTPVAVLLPAGFQLVGALLAVFRSGNIYLPVDASFHANKIKGIFEQTRPAVCITNRAHAPLAEKALTETCLYDSKLLIEEELSAMPDYFIQMPVVQADQPNYIFYTSGSTGEAKAILGCHDSLSHFIHWEIREFGLDHQCRVSQLCQFTFDASLRDILVPLAAGGTLLIPPAGSRTNIPLLVQWLEKNQVSLVHCVPSVFRLITRELQTQKDREATPPLRALQYVLMAGEQLYARDITAWRATGARHVQLVNLYGTSETTMAKTFHRIDKTPEDPAQAIHVGKPISNCVIAIVNNGVLCKPGEIGEIYIVTPFMTLGYYKNEPLTRTVFVQNPLIKDREELVYRTGDYGIYLDDGSVEVLGRKDDQIKVNGVRVEPGGIKQAVLRLKGIQDAEVIAVKNTQDENELFCYYIAAKDMEDELREFLPGELNTAQMPVAFCRLDDFPLTINGKVDKKALPRISKAVIPDEAYEPAVTPTEIKLEIIWKELLSLDRIGTKISFFRAGGASLKLIGMVSRIFHEFNVSLSFADVFANPTIGGLGAFIDQAVRQGEMTIKPLPVRSFYPITFAQRRLWFYDRFNGQKNLYNVVQAFELRGELQAGKLMEALAALSVRHEILRTVFINIGGEPKQRVLDPSFQSRATFYYDAEAFRTKFGSVQALIHQEQNRSFDLRTGPIHTATLAATGENSWALVFNWHHIISDGWSQDVVLEDLLQLYRDGLEGRSDTLKPLRFQFKDYADWANKQLEGQRLQELQQYWLTKFSKPYAPATFPYSFPGRAGNAGAGANIDFIIDGEIAEKVRAVARQTDVTPFVVLFAAVQILLNRYTGHTDLVTGSPFSGRNRLDLEGQTGCYINLMPLRMQVEEDDDLVTVVEKARDCITGAHRHQDFPVDMLTEQLETRPANARMLLFNILIQSQDDLEQKLEQPGEFSIRQIDTQAITCKADITFNFKDASKGLLGSLEYDTELYEQTDIERIIINLNQLLREMTTDPTKKASPLFSLNKQSWKTDYYSEKA